MLQRRREQLAQRVQVLLGTLIQRNVGDPRLQAVTITGVRLSGDASTATVFFSCYPAVEENDSLVEILNRAAGHLRRTLAHSMSARRTPALHFHYDQSLDSADRMEHLIRNLHHAADA